MAAARGAGPDAPLALLQDDFSMSEPEDPRAYARGAAARRGDGGSSSRPVPPLQLSPSSRSSSVPNGRSHMQAPEDPAPQQFLQQSASTGALRRSGGQRDWSWALTKPPKVIDTYQPTDAHTYVRHIKSPLTLTLDGKRSAECVLGAKHPVDQFYSVGTIRTRQKVTIDPSTVKKLPQTCNQLYGARHHEAERGAKYAPRNTCDVCHFANKAILNQTNYSHGRSLYMH